MPTPLRPAEVDMTDVEMTLSVTHKAVTELDDDTAAAADFVGDAAPNRCKPQGTRVFCVSAFSHMR